MPMAFEAGKKTVRSVAIRKIPPPAAPRLSAPFIKGGGEGAAERGIWTAQQGSGIERYSDRLAVYPRKNRAERLVNSSNGAQ